MKTHYGKQLSLVGWWLILCDLGHHGKDLGKVGAGARHASCDTYFRLERCSMHAVSITWATNQRIQIDQIALFKDK